MADPTAPTATGLMFEDFASDYAAKSPARTVTEADIVAFAGLSGDYNPLHTDAAFASRTPFGQRIAHGMLGLSAATGLASRLGFIDGTAIAFLGLDWKFRKPVLIGDTIHLVIRVASTREAPAMGGGIVTFAVRVVNQREEVVQKGRWNILVRSRAAERRDESSSTKTTGADAGTSSAPDDGGDAGGVPSHRP